MKETERIVTDLTNYVNSFTSKSKEFNPAMSREHRTLQQSFTKLCFEWIEHVASPDYQTDARNQNSQEMSSLIIKLLKEHYAKDGFTGASLDMMAKPSGHLGMI